MYIGMCTSGNGAWELVTMVREGARCRPDSGGRAWMGAFGTYVFGPAVSIPLAVAETA